MSSNRGVSNAIGFDLEHWHQATLVTDAVTDPTDRVRESLGIVLDLLDRHDVTATFFVVGELAEQYHDLVGLLADEGHELASHGHTHRSLFEMDPEGFERELRESREAIVDAAGVDPEGFRAPNFSVTRRTAWAFDVLTDSEYSYDSSVFPLRTPMYGVSGAPRRPYAVRPDDPFSEGRTDADEPGTSGDTFMEFPLTVLGSRPRLPLAGGFYARMLPGRLLERGVRHLNGLGVPANLYFHPWEFNRAVATDEPPFHARFISFHGIDSLPAKVASLLERFEFGPVRRLRDEYGSRSSTAPSVTDADRRQQHSKIDE